MTQNSFLWNAGNAGNAGDAGKADALTQRAAVDAMMRECETAARIVEARAPIRIDCRMNGSDLHSAGLGVEAIGNLGDSVHDCIRPRDSQARPVDVTVNQLRSAQPGSKSSPTFPKSVVAAQARFQRQ